MKRKASSQISMEKGGLYEKKHFKDSNIDFYDILRQDSTSPTYHKENKFY